MKIKKICMLAYTYYIFDPRVKREAEALAERGDKVDVICLREPGAGLNDYINNVNIMRLRMKKYQGNNPINYFLSYFHFFFRSFLKIAYYFLIKHYDIIHIHTMPDFLVFAAILPRLAGAKIILDVHDLMPELYVSKFRVKKDHFIIRLITFIERCCIAFADQAIAVHVAHQQALLEHGNPDAKLNILLNLPDPKIFIKKNAQSQLEFKKSEKIIFLYHGTISRRHGLELAIRGLKKIYNETPHIILKIIGDGDDLSRLISLTDELQLTNYVYFNKSFVTLEEVVKEIYKADIGIIPISVDCFTSYMLPTKLLEYVALGIPVICTQTPTIKEYFNDSMVCFFNSGNLDELAECMRELYFNIKKRNELVENANHFNVKYNWNIQKQLLYQIIDK